jgi:hypothetical protein
MNPKDNIIYGVDITKKVTPVMVRDAIIQCYYEAHCNVLELAKDAFYEPPKDTFEEMKKSHVKELIENIICETGGDFDNPSKDCLIQVLNHLQKIASTYREPETINKHVNEINQLIDKLDHI